VIVIAKPKSEFLCGVEEILCQGEYESEPCFFLLPALDAKATEHGRSILDMISMNHMVADFTAGSHDEKIKMCGFPLQLSLGGLTPRQQVETLLAVDSVKHSSARKVILENWLAYCCCNATHSHPDSTEKAGWVEGTEYLRSLSGMPGSQSSRGVVVAASVATDSSVTRADLREMEQALQAANARRRTGAASPRAADAGPAPAGGVMVRNVAADAAEWERRHGLAESSKTTPDAAGRPLHPAVAAAFARHAVEKARRRRDYEEMGGLPRP